MSKDVAAEIALLANGIRTLGMVGSHGQNY